jgi:hypothetical protein
MILMNTSTLVLLSACVRTQRRARDITAAAAISGATGSSSTTVSACYIKSETPSSISSGLALAPTVTPTASDYSTRLSAGNSTVFSEAVGVTKCEASSIMDDFIAAPHRPVHVSVVPKAVRKSEKG